MAFNRLSIIRSVVVASAFGLAVPTAVAEVVHFPSAVSRPVAVTEGSTQPAAPGFPIWGHLGKPGGSGPFPAVVLMHGCGGIQPSMARWAKQFNDLGYVTLMLDSFRPRSLISVCNAPGSSASPSVRALDAVGALKFLQGQAFVDGSRVGLIGWSHGGVSALGAVNRSGNAARLPQRFRVAVAFYPYCIRDRHYDLPVLILIGQADDWTPADLCRDLQARSRDAKIPIELSVYPGAGHGFDVREFNRGVTFDGFGGRTHTLKYDRAAHAAAAAQVEAFLARHLLRRSAETEKQ